MVEDRDPESATLGHERDPTTQRRRRRERRIHPDVRVRVDDTHAVRTDHRHAVLAAQGEESLFPLDSGSPDFPEAGCDHDEARNTLLPARLDRLECDLRGDRDDRQVDGIRDLEHARIRANPVDAPGVRVHGIDRPLVLVDDQVVEDRVSYFSGMARGSDDGDRGWGENRVEAGAAHARAKARRS